MLNKKEKMRLASRAHYLRNRERVLRDHKRYYNAHKGIADAGKQRPCMDCGIQYPTCAMDYDHRPDETKVLDICALARRQGNIAKLLNEMAKCDVVCSNCHRWRTHERQMIAKYGGHK